LSGLKYVIFCWKKIVCLLGEQLSWQTGHSIVAAPRTGNTIKIEETLDRGPSGYQLNCLLGRY